MTSRKKEEYVSLYGLILWLLEKELNSEADIYKAYNNVGHHLTRLFISNKYNSFFSVTIETTTNTERRSKLPDGAIQVIADFLKNIKTNQYSNCLKYKSALRDLDLVLAVQNASVSTLHKIETTPNYTFYDEIGNILKTFTNCRVVADYVELFLSSLLKRWGNPKIYKYSVERMEDFKTAEFIKNDYSDIAYSFVLNSNMINLNQNINSSNLGMNQLKEENEKLKKGLIEKEQRIKELELAQTIEEESKLAAREENNIIKVLAVLADMERKIDISKPYEAHGIMKQKAELLGMDRFPSNESIKKWFVKASEYKNPN